MHVVSSTARVLSSRTTDAINVGEEEEEDPSTTSQSKDLDRATQMGDARGDKKKLARRKEEKKNKNTKK